MNKELKSHEMEPQLDRSEVVKQANALRTRLDEILPTIPEYNRIHHIRFTSNDIAPSISFERGGSQFTILHNSIWTNISISKSIFRPEVPEKERESIDIITQPDSPLISYNHFVARTKKPNTPLTHFKNTHTAIEKVTDFIENL